MLDIKAEIVYKIIKSIASLPSLIYIKLAFYELSFDIQVLGESILYVFGYNILILKWDILFLPLISNVAYYAVSHWIARKLSIDIKICVIQIQYETENWIIVIYKRNTVYSAKF